MHDLPTSPRSPRTALLRRLTFVATIVALLTPGCGGGSGGSADPGRDAGAAGDAQIALVDDGGGAPDSGPEILDVTGTVIDPDGAPLAGRIVLVEGRTTTTDDDGQFSFADVTAPYDVIVTATGSSAVRVAVGLTTASPVIAYGWHPTLQQTTVTATVTGLPAPTSEQDDLVGVRSDYDSETWSRNPYNTLTDVLARWWGPPTVPTDLLFLRYTRTPDGTPIAYQGLGTASLELTGGMPIGGVTIAAVDPAETSLHATVTRPAEATDHMVTVHVAAAGASAQVATFDTQSVDVTLPSGAGVTAGLSATAWTPEGVGMRFVQGLPTSSTDVVLDVPAPPHLVSPVEGATGVAPGDEISWTWEGEGFFVVQVALSDGASGYAPSIEARTTRTSIVIPDLSALGIPWVAGRPVYVRVWAIGVPRDPAEIPAFDFDAFVGTVWGSDAMAHEDGTLGFMRDGVFLTSGS